MDEMPEPSTTQDCILVENISSHLAKYDIRSGPYPESSMLFRRAAVLIPITILNGEILLLLTKRSKELSSHPSTVAFPGGIRDETDASDIFTALREAEEEIGIPPSSVKILGVLTRGITLPNVVIYPVVGLIPNNFQPKLNPQEVQSTFYIPLKEFLSTDVLIMNFKIHGRMFRTFSLNYDCDGVRYVIYGFTANFCVFLAKIICEGNADELCLSLQDYFNHISQHHVISQSNSKL